MSPIFENCQTRNVCDYSLDKDYFEKVKPFITILLFFLTRTLQSKLQ